MTSSQQRHILITGGAGFIGSNFIHYFLKNNPTISVVNLDKLTYAGRLDNLEGLENNKRYFFKQGDICDPELLGRIFKEYQVDGIIHFAAESHVDNSIEQPDQFIKSNIDGTFRLLETARTFWDKDPGEGSKHRFHHISTDEVYGTLGKVGYFDEQTPYAPNSPYSASKAASDFLVRSYFHTYNLNVVTSNCSNNYGPRQHDEKLIPTIIRKAMEGEPIPIYGDGSNVRDWLYVEDHCRAIEQVFFSGTSGETYVIGADNEQNNLTIAKMICEIMDRLYPKIDHSYKEQISFVQDRPGHDFRYAIDASKIKADLGWKPEVNFEQGLENTVKWYMNKYQVA